MTFLPPQLNGVTFLSWLATLGVPLTQAAWAGLGPQAWALSSWLARRQRKALGLSRIRPEQKPAHGPRPEPPSPSPSLLAHAGEPFG